MELGFKEFAAAITLLTSSCDGKAPEKHEAPTTPVSHSSVVSGITGCRMRASKALHDVNDFTAATGTFLGSFDSIALNTFKNCLAEKHLPPNTELLPFPPETTEDL